MPAFPGGGGTISNPPLYPTYADATIMATNGNSATFSPFSGPKGSPFDALEYPKGTVQPIPSQRVAKTDDRSTGALSTGIGFHTTDNGQLVAGIQSAGVINPASGTTKGVPSGGPGAINGFTDEYQPGISMPSGTSLANTPVATNLYGAVLLAIGGGKNVITAGAGTDWSKGSSAPVPYNVQPLLNMGLGGSRDAGAGPAFTGFGMKSVIAPSDIAQGAAVETGFANRTAPAASGIVLKSGATAFGSATAASPVAS